MSVSNETICRIDNEHVVHATTQYEEIVEIPTDNENNKTGNNNEHEWTNVASGVATSTVLKDFIIDIIGLQLTKRTIEKYVLYRIVFTNLLGKNDKTQTNNPQHQLQIQNINTTWVQFALFKSGNVTNSSDQSGTGDSSSTSSTTDLPSKSIDYRINYEPGKKNKYILIVLSFATLMWFFNCLSLYVILASDFLRASIAEPGVVLTSLEFGVLIRCYFWFICLPKPRSVVLSTIPLILTLITVIGIAAMISVRYETEVLLNAYLVTLFITLFILVLSVTRFNLRSIMLYLHGIILAFLLSMIFIMITSYATGEPYDTERMVHLLIAVLIQNVALIMELQGIINGTSIAELDKRDHILGAFLIYTSIVTLFIATAKFVGLYKQVIK